MGAGQPPDKLISATFITSEDLKDETLGRFPIYKGVTYPVFIFHN